jgi:hypothetical protein
MQISTQSGVPLCGSSRITARSSDPFRAAKIPTRPTVPAAVRKSNVLLWSPGRNVASAITAMGGMVCRIRLSLPPSPRISRLIGRTVTVEWFISFGPCMQWAT